MTAMPPLICALHLPQQRVRVIPATVTGTPPPLVRIAFADVLRLASSLPCWEGADDQPGATRLRTGGGGAWTSARTFLAARPNPDWSRPGPAGARVCISDHILQSAPTSWRRDAIVARVGRTGVDIFNETDDLPLGDLPFATVQIVDAYAVFSGDGWSVAV